MKLIDKDALENIIRGLWKEDDGNNSEHRIYYDKALQDVQCEIDILEVKEADKEPVSMWHDVSEEPKPNMELICVGQYDNPLVLSSNSDSFKSRYISKWAYFNDLLNLYNVKRAVKALQEEPVSEDLEEEIKRYLHEVYDRDTTVSDIARHFANWQKKVMMKDALDSTMVENGEIVELKPKAPAVFDEMLDRPITEYPLSVRALNCLKSADINTLRELVRLTDMDLLKFRNFGKKSISELSDFIKDHNLTWGMNV